MFVFLEHDAAGAVAQHETVPVAVPGPARLLGCLVAGRQGARRAETPESQRRGGHFRAARDHQVRVAVLDATRRHADAVGGCRAGRHQGQIGSGQAVLDRDMPGNHVDDAAGNEKRRDLAGRLAGLEVAPEIPLDGFDAADAGADRHADAVRIGFAHLDARVLDRLAGGRDAVMHERVHLPRVLGREVGVHVEAGHGAAEACREATRVEACDRPDAAAPGEDVGPGFVHGAAHGRDDPEAGDHDTAPGQTFTSGVAAGGMEKQRPADGRRTADSVRAGLDVVDRLLDRGDLFRFLVRNLALEGLFERHHEFDGIQRVCAQVVHERGVIGDFFFFDAQLLGDDVLYLFFDAAHLVLILVAGGEIIPAPMTRTAPRAVLYWNVAGCSTRPPPDLQAMYIPPLTLMTSPVM